MEGKDRYFQHNNIAGNARGFFLMFSATDPSVLLLPEGQQDPLQRGKQLP